MQLKSLKNIEIKYIGGVKTPFFQNYCVFELSIEKENFRSTPDTQSASLRKLDGASLFSHVYNQHIHTGFESRFTYAYLFMRAHVVFLIDRINQKLSYLRHVNIRLCIKKRQPVTKAYSLGKCVLPPTG